MLTAAQIAAAAANLCYDGQYLCSGSHSEGASGTQDNDLAATSMSIADIQTDLGTGIAAFNRFKDDRGEYCRIGSGPDAIFDVGCAPEDLPNFLTVANATKIGDTDNVWKGRIRPWSLPEISASTWFLMYLGAPVKPFIALYQNKPSDLQVIASPESEYVILNGKAFFGVKGDYTVVPGDWRYILKFS
jgi:phage major head subunit gpT-like protein